MRWLYTEEPDHPLVVLQGILSTIPSQTLGSWNLKSQCFENKNKKTLPKSSSFKPFLVLKHIVNNGLFDKMFCIYCYKILLDLKQSNMDVFST